MDAHKRPSKENMRKSHISNPSFIYRQDGYELSYEIAGVFYHAKGFLSSIFPHFSPPRNFSIAFFQIILYNTSVIRV